MEKINYIKNYIDTLLNSDQYCLIIRGRAGLSKTSTVLAKLGELGLAQGTHYKLISGHVTPLRLYDILLNSCILESPSLLVFDDVASILKTSSTLIFRTRFIAYHSFTIGF